MNVQRFPSRCVRLSVSLVSLVLVFTGSAVPAELGESSPSVRQRAAELSARQIDCEDNLRLAQQRRNEANLKPYLSADDRDQDWGRLERARDAVEECVKLAEDQLLKALAALEIECQKDADEGRDADRSCAGAARAQRVGRLRLQELREVVSTCTSLECARNGLAEQSRIKEELAPSARTLGLALEPLPFRPAQPKVVRGDIEKLLGADKAHVRLRLGNPVQADSLVDAKGEFESWGYGAIAWDPDLGKLYRVRLSIRDGRVESFSFLSE